MSLDDLLSYEPLEFNEDDLGEYILQILSGGLYIEPHLIIREYIQNAHDAITAWKLAPTPGRIDIKIEQSNIHIIDNGPGMSRDELVHSMRKIGISPKPFGQASGFMGIGKLAGLSIAEKVQIDTSKHGVPYKNRVVFNGAEMLQAISDRRRAGASRPILATLNEHSRLNREQIPESADVHYTAVHLINVNERAMDEMRLAGAPREEFLKLLGLVSPVRQDPKFEHAADIEKYLDGIAPEHYCPLEIVVNGMEVYRPWVPNLQKPTEINVVDEDGIQLAYGWACLHKDTAQIPDENLRGIALMKRGIAVGQRRLASDLGLWSSGEMIHFRWYMGELYIADEDILLTANRMDFQRDERAKIFIQRATPEFKKLNNTADRFSRRENATKAVPRYVRDIKEAEQDILEGKVRQETLPAITKKIVQAQFALASKLNWIEQDQKQHAVDAIAQADQLLQRLSSSTSRVDGVDGGVSTPQVPSPNEPPLTDSSVSPSKSEGVAPSADSGANVENSDDSIRNSTLTNGSSDVPGPVDALNHETSSRDDSSDSETAAGIDDDEVSVADEEAQEILSIPDRFGFSTRERKLFQVVVEILAQQCGGQTTEKFVGCMRSLEEALETTL